MLGKPTSTELVGRLIAGKNPGASGEIPEVSGLRPRVSGNPRTRLGGNLPREEAPGASGVPPCARGRQLGMSAGLPDGETLIMIMPSKVPELGSHCDSPLHKDLQ